MTEPDDVSEHATGADGSQSVTETDGASDTRVTITGRAFDSHSGAMIEREGEPSIYIADLEYWPDEMRGRPVEATGVIRQRDPSPEPAVSDLGIMTHGARDAGLLELTDADWHAIDEASDDR